MDRSGSMGGLESNTIGGFNGMFARQLPVTVQRILEYIRVHGNITMKAATELCGYKARSATRKIIDKMQEKQLIEKVGDGPKLDMN